MYKDFFGFREEPFSIVPSSRYLFLSQRHREAMQHLQAGLGQGGGFAMLTGEVGTGKTTVAKAMLASLTDKTASALILNPTFSSKDLLEAICDEFAIEYPENASLKRLSQGIYRYLQHNDQQGINTLVVIDEAQHLSADVLEQLRLLTNLETDERKLLKVLLIGQPELQDKLRTTQLRQLAQRITGRYHLLPLTEGETRQYIEFRLSKAGGELKLFTSSGISVISHASQGVPRLINLMADKCLYYAYHSGEKQVSKTLAHQACNDIIAYQAPGVGNHIEVASIAVKKGYSPYLIAGVAGVLVAGLVYWQGDNLLNHFKTQSDSQVKVNQESQQVIEPNEVRLSNKAIESNKTEATANLPLSIEQDSFSEQDRFPEPEVATQAQLELKQYLSAVTDKIAAIQELYAVWGYQAGVLDGLCESKSNQLFQCQKELGTFEQLVAGDVPVVLSLLIDNQMSYVTLYQVNDDKAQVLNGEQRIVLPVSQLQQYWSGEYYRIWQRELTETLRMNQTGEQVRKLDEKLSIVLGEPVSDRYVFDETLKNKVELFQRWQKMTVDGIAGRNTLKRLDLMTQHQAPSLKGESVQ
ncbi:ExeA family protein [Vibrio hippocampi]|uniref:AAA+ ATPase domain-containing protein n=1 Tax=Vibrio hippocampi TaxID=654686 RepID=A0ABM8ZJX7_9VIBR|nr:ExeA family protein [Vibrio hippocampi]CAH0526888.1 hypothetical protein VHP8226_02264 [Vibrio hippocampi]